MFHPWLPFSFPPFSFLGSIPIVSFRVFRVFRGVSLFVPIREDSWFRILFFPSSFLPFSFLPSPFPHISAPRVLTGLFLSKDLGKKGSPPSLGTIVVQPSRLPKRLGHRTAGGTPAPQTWRRAAKRKPRRSEDRRGFPELGFSRSVRPSQPCGGDRRSRGPRGRRPRGPAYPVRERRRTRGRCHNRARPRPGC